MRPGLVRLLWGAAFLAALFGPTLLSLVNGNDNPLVSQLAVQTGLLATGMLVASVVIPSRMRSLTRSLGIEGVLGTHRSLGLLVVLMVLLHMVLVLVANPNTVTLFDPRQWSMPSRFAVGSTLAMIALVGLALVRNRARSYEWWRWSHILLAVASVVFAALHIWYLQHLVYDPLLRVAFGLLAAGLLGVLSYRWLWRPWLDRRGAYEVHEIRVETDNVHTLVIGPRGARHGFIAPVGVTYEPGQFAWIRTRPSVTAEEHPFTIASCPEGSETIEFTIRNVGDFTSTVGSLRVGDPVWIDGPHGAFTWDDRVISRALVLIAAGVGITPMMSMLRALALRGDTTPVMLISGARHEHELLFRAEIDELSALLDLTLVEALSRPPEGWTGYSGRVDGRLLAEVLPQRTDRRKIEYFICGPSPMVTGVLEGLAALGVDPASIHTEQFDMV
jgi:predicted ferric reductase